jgi:hypothetical protein
MHGSSESFFSRLEASFLLTPDEKASLALLCGSPEFGTAITPLLEEMLLPVFTSEAHVAPVISQSVRKELFDLVQEEEAKERAGTILVDTAFM